MEPLTLKDALTSARMQPKHRELMQAFAARIPVTLRSMFFVDMGDMDGLATLEGIRLCPDNAIERMNSLTRKAEDDNKHGNPRSIRLSYDEIVDIVKNVPALESKREKKSYGDQVYVEKQPAAAYYTSCNMDYAGSFLLQDALEMQDLSHVESQRLRRMAMRIPEGVRDAFTVDLVRVNGELRVEAFALSPMVTAELLKEHGISVPIPKHFNGTPIRRAAFEDLTSEPIAVTRNKAS